jgi:hypothetical protein
MSSCNFQHPGCCQQRRSLRVILRPSSRSIVVVSMRQRCRGPTVTPPGPTPTVVSELYRRRSLSSRSSRSSRCRPVRTSTWAILTPWALAGVTSGAVVSTLRLLPRQERSSSYGSPPRALIWRCNGHERGGFHRSSRGTNPAHA